MAKLISPAGHDSPFTLSELVGCFEWDSDFNRRLRKGGMTSLNHATHLDQVKLMLKRGRFELPATYDYRRDGQTYFQKCAWFSSQQWDRMCQFHIMYGPYSFFFKLRILVGTRFNVFERRIGNWTYRFFVQRRTQKALFGTGNGSEYIDDPERFFTPINGTQWLCESDNVNYQFILIDPPSMEDVFEVRCTPHDRCRRSECGCIEKHEAKRSLMKLLDRHPDTTGAFSNITT